MLAIVSGRTSFLTKHQYELKAALLKKDSPLDGSNSKGSVSLEMSAAKPTWIHKYKPRTQNTTQKRHKINHTSYKDNSTLVLFGLMRFNGPNFYRLFSCTLFL